MDYMHPSNTSITHSTRSDAHHSWGSGLCRARGSGGRVGGTAGTRRSGPRTSPPSIHWTTHIAHSHPCACWHHSWGSRRACDPSRSSRTHHNLQGNNPDLSSFFYYSYMRSFRLPHLRIHFCLCRGTCCLDSEADTLRRSGQLWGCDTRCSHWCLTRHMRRSQHDNAHTRAASCWQSKLWDNHPHTRPHEGSTEPYTLRHKKYILMQKCFLQFSQMQKWWHKQTSSPFSLCHSLK